MHESFLLIALGALLLAYANGANDNFKGVATLYGSGVLSYRSALWAGTGVTWLGSVAALVLAGQLVKAFSGKGLVDPGVLAQGAFPVAVAAGAAATVLAATRLGLPISTTHALIGALVGAGLSAGSLDLGRLGSTFLVPLAVSPLLAVPLAGVGYRGLHLVRRGFGLAAEACLCLDAQPAAAPVTASGTLAAPPVTAWPLRLAAPVLRVGNAVSCRIEGRSLPGVSARGALGAAHCASGLLVSFARGLNDAPKIAGVLLIGTVLSADQQPWVILAVATVMGAGGLLSARRVARVMSLEITPLNEGQGFTANLVTSLLVLGASNFGLPVSTTHVSCGSLFGIGTATGEGRWRTMASILGAWILTLPAAAATAAAVYGMLPNRP